MSEAIEAHEELDLTVRLANKRPIELVDLGQSFEALGELYSEFVHSRGYEPIAGNARLYVIDLRSGSIVAILKGLLDQASFLMDHLDVLAGFLSNVNDLIKFFSVQEGSKEVTITRGEALPQLAPERRPHLQSRITGYTTGAQEWSSDLIARHGL